MSITCACLGTGKMAATDDWLYSDDLEVGIAERERLGSSESRVLDGDLLDDVLTAPPSRLHNSHTPTNEDELLGVKNEDSAMEDSGSARFMADQMARTVQARIEANKASQGASSGGSNIYSREPNRRNAILIGNLTWWTTDQDLILAVKEAGLQEVLNLKFFENRANGQSKGYALIELHNEVLAMNAADKFNELTIHGQQPIVVYAAKMSPHQFEAKCNAAKSGVSGTVSLSSSSSASSLTNQKPALPKMTPPLNLPAPPPMRPPLPMPLPGMPHPGMHGFRPPGMGNDLAMGFPPGLPPPPPGLAGFPPNLGGGGGGGMGGGMGGLGMMARPGFPPLPPGMGGGMDMMKGGVAPHLNPAFLQHEMNQGGANMAELFARFRNQAAAALGGMGPGMGGSGNGPGSGGGGGGGRGKGQPSDDELADANQRNRAISSSAITRAISDANAGDFESAIDTLKMAITLIKQSITAGTETSQILIQSLQDCLRGIEAQEDEAVSGSSKRSSRIREHRSHDDRDRSGRSSSHRSSKHHRDRSRERRR